MATVWKMYSNYENFVNVLLTVMVVSKGIKQVVMYISTGFERR